MAIASSSAPNTFIQNMYLREALKILNESYKPLSRNQVSSNIDNLYNKLITEMQSEIDTLTHFSLCIDFWPESVTGFIGITMNNEKKSELKSMLLTLDQVDYPHTSGIILQRTNTALQFWNINGVSDPRIVHILTDNGGQI